MTTTVKIKTPNPEALSDTLGMLRPGLHVVKIDTYSEGVVDVETNNPDWLVFACQRQGYGEVVGEQ